MFIVLFIAMRAVAIKTFGNVFDGIQFLIDASPLLTFVTACFLGDGLFYFRKPDN